MKQYDLIFAVTKNSGQWFVHFNPNHINDELVDHYDYDEFDDFFDDVVDGVLTEQTTNYFMFDDEDFNSKSFNEIKSYFEEKGLEHDETFQEFLEE